MLYIGEESKFQLLEGYPVAREKRIVWKKWTTRGSDAIWSVALMREEKWTFLEREGIKKVATRPRRVWKSVDISPLNAQHSWRKLTDTKYEKKNVHRMLETHRALSPSTTILERLNLKECRFLLVSIEASILLELQTIEKLDDLRQSRSRLTFYLHDAIVYFLFLW